jgi:FkbM family methyltransferase
MSNVRDDFIAIAKQAGVRVVYECGSRDALDGLRLADALDADELHVFECNPQAIELCRQNIASSSCRTKIHLNPLAVCERPGELDFYPIDPAATKTDWKDGNIGASSLYRANPAWPYEQYVQRKIRVQATALDTYCNTRVPPDLLWMDLQGAELRVLQGAAAVLPKIKLLHLEVSFRPLYLGQPLFWELDRFLRERFKLLRLYDIRSRMFLKLNSLLDREKWFTDAVYINRASAREGT